MVWFDDLSTCNYWRGDGSSNLIAVGWLSQKKPYAKGAVSREIQDKLWEFLRGRPWGEPRVLQYRGCHLCDLCENEKDEHYYSVKSPKGEEISIGIYNLIVPDRLNQRLFVSPSTIIHYIVDHNYCPPKEFQEAVQNCPNNDLPEFFEGLEELIPKEECWQEHFYESYGAALAASNGLSSKRELSLAFQHAYENKSMNALGSIGKSMNDFSKDAQALIHLISKNESVKQRAFTQWLETIQRTIETAKSLCERPEMEY